MKKLMFWSLILIIFFLWVGLLPRNVEAIPTFARKYRTSCTTCHVAIPKRNAFGDAFRKLGYRIPGGDAAYVKEEPVRLGAKAWEKVWPEAIWPGLLPATVPISFYVHQRFVWKEDATARTTFDAPHEFELFTGGNFGEKIGWFGEWVVVEGDKVGESRLGELYIQFNDLVGDSPASNFKFGKFETGATSLGGLKDNNRLTLAHPLVYDFTVPGGGDDKSLRTKQPGVELNGIYAGRFMYALGIVNGNGKVSDDNSEKDGFIGLRYKFGGMGFDGTGGLPEKELAIQDNWRDDSIAFGAFGYLGQPATGDIDEDYTRIGFDFRAKYSRLDLWGAVVFGDDEVIGGPDIDDTVAFSVNLDYLFYPWLIGTVRYSEVDYDPPSIQDIEKITFNITALQRANVRWTLEGVFFDKDVMGADTIKLNVMFAF